MTQPTPGPWEKRVDHDGSLYLQFRVAREAEAGECWSTCAYAELQFDTSDFDDFDRERWDATLDLIASAPDLAAENRELRQEVDMVRRRNAHLSAEVRALHRVLHQVNIVASTVFDSWPMR